MVRESESLSNDDRAVSPVIGVILMVAITVILAAVIGTFVLGLGDSLNQAPQATLDADAAANSADISHNGGDGMAVSDLRINIGGDSFDFSAADGFSAGDEFTVGDTASFVDGSGLPSGTVGSYSGSEVRIRVIHTPSESVLMDKTVDVPA